MSLLWKGDGVCSIGSLIFEVTFGNIINNDAQLTHLTVRQKGVCRSGIEDEVLCSEDNFLSFLIDCFEDISHNGQSEFASRICIKPVTLANFTLGPDNGVNGSQVLPPTCESAPPSGMHRSCVWLKSMAKHFVWAWVETSF